MNSKENSAFFCRSPFFSHASDITSQRCKNNSIYAADIMCIYIYTDLWGYICVCIQLIFLFPFLCVCTCGMNTCVYFFACVWIQMCGYMCLWRTEVKAGNYSLLLFHLIEITSLIQIQG